MSETTERIVQAFIDAVANRAVFCDGSIMTYEVNPGPVTLEPNCQKCNECPLYRKPDFRVYVYPWRGTGSAKHGCEPFYLWERWKKDQQLWLVTFQGEKTVEARGRDPLSAACTAWWDMRMSGKEIDKMVLFEKRYHVREA